MGPGSCWRSTSKELTPFPHPGDPHSLCEIYLRVAPSEGWVSRRPGGPPGLRWGASYGKSLLPHDESNPPPHHCEPFPGLSPWLVAVGATVSACTILIQHFQAPPRLLTPLPSSSVQGSEEVCQVGRGQGLQRHVALYLGCSPREGTREGGLERGGGGS